MARFDRVLAFLLSGIVSFGLVSHAVVAEPGVAGPGEAHAMRLADEDSAKKDTAAAAPGKSGGTIDGFVTAIDYRSSTMSVAAGSRKVDVSILPSTNIQGPNNGFRTIADIAKGSHVRVLLSQRAGLFTAQIITLR